MKFLGIDPGTFKTAFAIIDEKLNLYESGILDNEVFVAHLPKYSADHTIIEMLKSYGNIMGDNCLETCVWIGRFIQSRGGQVHLLPRKTIVTQVCNNPKAKDSNVRASLIDIKLALMRQAARQGLCPNQRDVIGTKSQPGPFYEVHNDIWSAIAVAWSWCQIKSEQERMASNLLS